MSNTSIMRPVQIQDKTGEKSVQTIARFPEDADVFVLTGFSVFHQDTLLVSRSLDRLLVRAYPRLTIVPNQEGGKPRLFWEREDGAGKTELQRFDITGYKAD